MVRTRDGLSCAPTSAFGTVPHAVGTGSVATDMSLLRSVWIWSTSTFPAVLCCVLSRIGRSSEPSSIFAVVHEYLQMNTNVAEELRPATSTAAAETNTNSTDSIVVAAATAAAGTIATAMRYHGSIGNPSPIVTPGDVVSLSGLGPHQGKRAEVLPIDQWPLGADEDGEVQMVAVAVLTIDPTAILTARSRAIFFATPESLQLVRTAAAATANECLK
jgi:hypothetical protein